MKRRGRSIKNGGRSVRTHHFYVEKLIGFDLKYGLFNYYIPAFCFYHCPSLVPEVHGLTGSILVHS